MPGEDYVSMSLSQYFATFTGNLVVLCGGMHSSWPSPTLPLLLNGSSKVTVTSGEGAWLAATPCFGAPFGAIISALLVDKIGRKSCILICSPLYLIAWILIAYAKSVPVLFIARFIAGSADGFVFVVFPMYVAEISHPSARGLLVSTVTVAFTTGCLIINCLGLYFSIRVTALIGASIPLIHFLAFMWMPESPVYKHMKDKSKETERLTGNTNGNLNDYPRFNNKPKLWSLVSEPNNRRALGISIGLRVVQQFSANFVILFYCLLIFNEAHGALSGSTATIIYFTIQIISSIFSSLLMDCAGRRPLLIISIIGSGITLATQGVYFYLKNETTVDTSTLGFLPVVALVLYNILFNFGLSNIPTVVISELFSTRIKSVALCVCDMFFALTVFIATKFFQVTKDQYGMHVPFFTFALCCVGGLVFVVKCLPETKGKTLHEIQVEFNS